MGAPFPTPYPPSSISTGYSGNNINTNVQVPGAPVSNSNLDQLIMHALMTPRPQAQQQVMSPRRQMQALEPQRERAPAPRAAYNEMPNSATLPGAQFRMNQTGNWGNFVDATDPRARAYGVGPGFYGGPTNWDLSNPNIQGAPAYGKTGRQSGGAGSYGPGMQAPQPSQESNSGFDYLPRAEQLRWLEASRR